MHLFLLRIIYNSLSGFALWDFSSEGRLSSRDILIGNCNSVIYEEKQQVHLVRLSYDFDLNWKLINDPNLCDFDDLYSIR